MVELGLFIVGAGTVWKVFANRRSKRLEKCIDIYSIKI